MKKIFILLTGLALTLQSFSQDSTKFFVIRKDSMTCMNNRAYDLMALKWYESDTLIALQKEQIRVQDSINANNSKIIKSQSLEIIQKDSTINKISVIAKGDVKSSPRSPWVYITIGVEAVIILLILLK